MLNFKHLLAQKIQFRCEIWAMVHDPGPISSNRTIFVALFNFYGFPISLQDHTCHLCLCRLNERSHLHSEEKTCQVILPKVIEIFQVVLARPHNIFNKSFMVELRHQWFS